MTDVLIEFTGTKAEVLAAFETLDLTEELVRDGELASYNHHVGLDFVRKPLLTAATYDENGDQLTAPIYHTRPVMRLRFMSVAAKRKAKEKIVEAGGLPAALTKLPANFLPHGPIWAGD